MFGFHFAMNGLPCCWSKQYFEWSHEAEASLNNVKDGEGHTERLKPELRLVKSEPRWWRWLLLLLTKAESPDPRGKLWRGRNSETLASCRQLRFFWRDTSRHSPVNKVGLACFQMIFVGKTFHWRPSKVLIGWIRIFNHHNFYRKIHLVLQSLQDQVHQQMLGPFLRAKGWILVLRTKIAFLLLLYEPAWTVPWLRLLFVSVFLNNKAPGRFPELDLAMCPLLCWPIGNSPGFSDFGELLWYSW